METLQDGQVCPRCDRVVSAPMHSCHVARDNFIVAYTGSGPEFAARQGSADRNVLVHLNVALGPDDPRGAKDVKDAILGALEVGSDHETMRGLTIEAPLAEEV